MTLQHCTLIYIADPMCPWSYGFSPELEKIKAAFPDVPFELVMGGLRPDGDQTIGELKPILWEDWKNIQKLSGQKFNFAILNQSAVRFNTEPACRAVIVAEKLKPGINFLFLKAIQEAFFIQNLNMQSVATYAELAMTFGIDGDKYHDLFNKSKSKMDTYSEFDLTKSIGIQSFPALLAKIEGKLYVASNGYQKAERIIALLKGRGLE